MSHLQLKCEDIVSYFHKSPKYSEKLGSFQEQLSLPQLKLIQDVATRWNSTDLMMEQIFSQHKAITILCLLNKAELRL